MMKKDIRYIAMGVAFATIALAGCSQFQEDNLFDESAALRIEHNAEKLQNILVDAPNGWVLQYYTGRGISVFEGFNLFAKFERSGKVTLAGDHRFLRNGNAGKYTEHSSLYELIREDGLVLAFNTWNDVLTPFVDPVAFWAAPDILVKDGEGMQGDQNLVVKFMSKNQIILRGERYDAEVRLVKADRDWQTYIADTKAMKERFTSDDIDSYYITAGDQTMYVVGLKNGRYRISERVKNPLKVDSLSCCFTPYGFRNESVDTLAGHIFQEFKMAEDGSALLSEDGSVRIIATWDTYLAENPNVLWFDVESLSDDLKALYDQLEPALKMVMSSATLLRVGIGDSQATEGEDDIMGLVLEWKPTRRTQPVTGGLALKRNVPALGQMAISCAENAKIDQKLKDAISEGGVMNPTVEKAIRDFGAALAGTYQMAPNSYFLPTDVLFQSLDGSKSFRIVKGE